MARSAALVVALGVLTLGALHGAEADGLALGLKTAIDAPCPKRMVELRDIGVCIDRFEASTAARHGRTEAVAQKGGAPARAISFHEAEAACGAAGLRLCSSAEWTRACAGSEGRAYPYGPGFDPGRCTTTDPDRADQPSAPTPSGQAESCQTPEGIFDLSGNVWEWTLGEDDSGNLRELRGGGFGNGERDVPCVRHPAIHQPPEASFDGYGFRCCRDAQR